MLSQYHKIEFALKSLLIVYVYGSEFIMIMRARFKLGSGEIKEKLGVICCTRTYNTGGDV